MSLLSRAQIVSLITSLTDKPVLSVYIDGSATDPSSPQWRLELEHAIDAARQASRLDHAGRQRFEKSVDLLYERLAGHATGLGAPGWVGFIGPTEVHYSNSCPVPLPTLVRWETGAWIAPYIAALTASCDAVLALVDSRRVEIFDCRASQLRRIEEFRAHHFNGQATHLGSAARPGFHVGTRGGTGRDRLQRALREGNARMEREAVPTLERRAREGAIVLVAGTPQHRRDLMKRLSSIPDDQVLELDDLDIHATMPELVAGVEAGCDRLRRRRIEREVMAVIDSAGGRGSAALGQETTRWALDQGRVQSLFLTRRFLDDHAIEAERDVRSALAQQAEIAVVSDGGASALDARGGVGARLRYRLV